MVTTNLIGTAAHRSINQWPTIIHPVDDMGLQHSYGYTNDQVATDWLHRPWPRNVDGPVVVSAVTRNRIPFRWNITDSKVYISHLQFMIYKPLVNSSFYIYFPCNNDSTKCLLALKPRTTLHASVWKHFYMNEAGRGWLETGRGMGKPLMEPFDSFDCIKIYKIAVVVSRCITS